MRQDAEKVREITDAFTSGAIFDADEKKLNEYLGFIIDTDKNHYHSSDGRFDKAAISPLISTILSIRQQRLVSAIEESNKKTQFWFAFLAIASLGVGVLQLLVALIDLICKK